MLNKSKGNMYEWVTHTYNTIKGTCPHDCSYCYMKRWGKLNPVRFDEKELKTDLGTGNFIFVGSSCDMFANDIQKKWIDNTLKYCFNFNNKYLFQTKNPERIHFFDFDYKNSIFCTTIETNRWYPEIMNNCPTPQNRAYYMPIGNYVTIEPIMDFDLKHFIDLIKMCSPKQVNIGADSGNNKLPEPPKEKIIELIKELEKFTIVKQKSNLKRLLK
jgi:hypothetical protein